MAATAALGPEEAALAAAAAAAAAAFFSLAATMEANDVGEALDWEADSFAGEAL